MNSCEAPNGWRYRRLGRTKFTKRKTFIAQKKAKKTRRVPAVRCTKKERGSFFTPETVQQMGKVYSQVTDLQAVQSSGGMPKRHPRGAPWLPVTLIYALVARGLGEDPDDAQRLISIRDRVLSITAEE